MRLRELILVNFRTYAKYTVQFPRTITVILGPNAVGKTNVLEAILLAAYGKSFRAQRDADMVRWGTEVAHVTVSEERADGAIQLQTILTTGSVNGQPSQIKKFLVNGVPRRQVDFAGNLRAVLFSPTDLELVTDSPSLRRGYLDTVLTLTDREYRRNLGSYERGLRQRNSLLFAINDGKASRSQLLFWDQLLIKSGEYLTRKREELIQFVNDFVLDGLSYRLVYDPSIISRERLAQYADAEVAAKVTLVGPQRDDFRFLMSMGNVSETADDEGNTDVARFGSRGQQRLAVLWIKLAELAYIEHAVGERPILLLDDIFSELDEQSRRIVLSVIEQQQTIITSAEHVVRDQLAEFSDIGWIELTRET
jgi:DNA replication and repair protein RecF